MLSRTAENLYWLARYVERAESVARLVDVALRMSAMPFDPGTGRSEWKSAIIASGCEKSFYAKYADPTAETVIRHLVRDLDNPSSILSCLATARRNSRAVRTALTVDMWEAINGTWLAMRGFGEDAFTVGHIPRFLDWVKERSTLFSGAALATMLQTDAFWFTRLGTYIERADNTARILDVKYNVLLPRHEPVGGTLDHYQWAAILSSVSSRRAYQWLYHDRIKPWLVAELLILRPEMPRSLITCVREINYYLDVIGGVYRARRTCHELAARVLRQLNHTNVEQIFQVGLHEFLTEFIDGNTELGTCISQQYFQAAQVSVQTLDEGRRAAQA
ncbi:MAG TPA: alpha-E domain-containing protein [Alphaproteobacteria bacterium]|nr:alpha-E domain-containing protein [Alphaproteobacteria bacterium]